MMIFYEVRLETPRSDFKNPESVMIFITFINLFLLYCLSQLSDLLTDDPAM